LVAISNPSQTPEVNAMPTTTDECKNCGSTKIVPGSIDDASFKASIPWTRLVLSDCVFIKAIACLDCGEVSLRVDPEKLKAILGSRDEETK